MAQRARIQKYPFIALAFLLSGMFFYAGVRFCVAKMVSEPIDRDGGGVDVARWEVTTTSNDQDELDVVANGNAQSYTFTVTNKSSVANTYKITVSNIPAGVKIGIDGGGLQDPTNGEIIFESANYELDAANGNNYDHDDHTLNISATLDAAVETNEITINVEYMQKELE